MAYYVISRQVGITDFEAAVNYLEINSPLNSEIEGRIKLVWNNSETCIFFIEYTQKSHLNFKCDIAGIFSKTITMVY